MERVGGALVAPRATLARVDRGEGGAPDAFLLLVLKLVCGEARALVAVAWAALVTGPGAALSALVNRLSATLGLDLALLLGGGLLITILAGRRRAPASDFDLACVAWTPVLAIDVTASLIVQLGGWAVPERVTQALTVVALGWMLALCALAVRVARARVRAEAA